MKHSAGYKPITLLVLLIVPPIICRLFDVSQPQVTSIFITVIGLWLTEAIPLPVTGLLVPVLAALFGVLPAAKAFESFGSDILFLFLGCFLMGRSMEKHSFDKRLAYFLLGRCIPNTSFVSINIVIALTCFVLSMWISNTAATAIMSAVTIGILASLDDQMPNPEIRKNASVRLLLTCAFASSIGGLATPVGTPPNLIAVKFLSQSGINVSFFNWLVIALPLSLCALVVMLILFKWCFPLPSLSFDGAKEHFQKLLKDLGPMAPGERQIALIFLFTIALWVLPGALHSAFPESAVLSVLNARLSMSVVGLLGGLFTFFLPLSYGDKLEANLAWHESDKVEWGTLMLFGGGLTLGVILEDSGAAKELAAYIFGSYLSSLLVLAAVLVVLSIVMSEFASNTAAASILIPLVIAAGGSMGFESGIIKNLVLATAFAASFGFMLPISTPPNAIVYATGRVPASAMRQVGVFFDVSGAVLIVAYLFLF